MNKKIFIIEDDINILSSLRAKFSAQGIKVSVSDGTEKIKDILWRIKKEKVDYIVLDLILPHNDGFTILEKIKEDADISIIPVFIFTDLSDEDSKIRCQNLGADYYFMKGDFSIDGFAEKVKRIIENKDRVTHNA